MCAQAALRAAAPLLPTRARQCCTLNRCRLVLAPRPADPVGGGPASNQVDPADWANYVLLLNELRAAMDTRWPKRRMELTIAMGMNPQHSDLAPMESLANVLDAINLMT